MKYPTSPLSPFLAALLCIRRRMRILSEQREPKGLDQLSARTPIACALLNSLASLFPLALVCFQSFADSFGKTPGGGGTPRLSRLPRSSRGTCHSFTPSCPPRGVTRHFPVLFFSYSYK